jgi:hypothetical protein
MLQILSIYLAIGLVWSFIHEFLNMEITNSLRIRLVIFWPITLTAFLLGIIEAIIDNLKK